MLPDKAKFTVCSLIKLASIAFDETSSYWSAKKISAFHWSIQKISAFDWSPLLTCWVVHLPKLTGMGLMTASAAELPYHEISPVFPMSWHKILCY